MEEFVLRIPEQYPMTDDELFALCAANKELRIERDEFGQIIIMSPSGGITGNINFRISGIFYKWVEEHPDLGYGFDSATGFRLPDQSMRSPDVSWVKKEKWEALKREDQEKFVPVCPDFVIEIRSKSDSLSQLQLKMEKWISNGCSLAWLIDPLEQKVYTYTSGASIQTIQGFDQIITGSSLLPGFKLELAKLR